MSVAFDLWLKEIGISDEQKDDVKIMKILEALWNEIQEIKE